MSLLRPVVVVFFLSLVIPRTFDGGRDRRVRALGYYDIAPQRQKTVCHLCARSAHHRRLVYVQYRCPRFGAPAVAIDRMLTEKRIGEVPYNRGNH